MRKFAILSVAVLVTTALNHAARHALQAPDEVPRREAPAARAGGAPPPAEGAFPRATPAAGSRPAPPVERPRPALVPPEPAEAPAPLERPMFGPDGVPFRRVAHG